MGITEQEKRKNVIKGLECLAAPKGRVHTCTPFDCPYTDLHTCFAEIAKDTLALLKEQEPRVMTLEEVKSCGNPVWLEWNYHFIKPALLHSEEVMTDDNRNAVAFVLFGEEEWYTCADDDYGKEWRCWTSRPTEAEREATPWND